MELLALLVAQREKEAGEGEGKSCFWSTHCVPIVPPIVTPWRMAFGFMCTRKLRLREVNPTCWDCERRWRCNPVTCLTLSQSSSHCHRGMTLVFQRCTDWALSALTHSHAFNFHCELGVYYLHYTDEETKIPRDEGSAPTNGHRWLRVHHVLARAF